MNTIRVFPCELKVGDVVVDALGGEKILESRSHYFKSQSLLKFTDGTERKVNIGAKLTIKQLVGQEGLL